MNRFRLLVTLTLFLFDALLAGERISLREAVERAQSFGYDVAMVRSERDAAQAEANKSLSVFLPQIRISSSYTATNDPLNVFGMKLKERSVSPADFDPAVLNSPDRFLQYTTKIEVQQPLINLDAFWGRGAALDAARGTEQKEARTKRYAAFRAKTAYFQLVLARQSREVIAAAERAARANAQRSAKYLDEGLINRSDYLLAQVRLLGVESKILEVENAVHDAEGALRMLLGAADSTEFVPTDTLAVAVVDPGTVDVEEVNRSRSDMQAMQYAVDASEGALRMHQLKLLPTLNAFGSYDWNDQRLFGRQGTGWMIGAVVQWNIFPGFNQIAEIQKAGANLEHARTDLERQRAQNRNDIGSALRSLESLRKRLTLSDEAVRHAAENYRILSERYASGIGTTADLLSAEASLSDARLGRLQSIAAHNTVIFTLELLTERDTHYIQ